jgi:polyferredoxin
MNKEIKNAGIVGLLGVLLSVPVSALAQAPAQGIKPLILFLANLFQGWLIPLMVLASVVYVVWTALQYIQTDENSNAKNEKREQIFWGIIGLFVILSVWSLVAVVQNTFQVFSGGTLQSNL